MSFKTMEDIKKKLELNNPHIQIKALWKLYSEILKKSKADGAIRHTRSEGPELKFLWQKCTSENHVICSTTCQVLVELLCQKALEFKYIYQGFINLVPSARNLYGIVPALGEMLTLQALNRDTGSNRYVCPFQMRNPAHPFIIVLSYHCESWNIIQQQVHSLYHHPNSRVRCLASEILKPFIQFVFLQPLQETNQQSIRNSLQEVLLNASQEEEYGEIVIRMLVDILPGLQIKSREDLGRTVQFLTQLLHVINNRQNYATTDNVIGPLLSFSISIIQSSLKRNLGITTTLQEILCCLKNIKRIHNKESCIVLLADILSSIGLDIALDVLFICKEVLLDKEDNDVCQMAGATLVLPLLQLMSVPSEHRHSVEIRNVTSQLLSLIDRLPVQTSRTPNEIESSSLFIADASSCHMYASLIHEFSADRTGEKAREWMSNVKDSLGIMKTIPHSMTNLVSSLLVTSASQSLTESCLSTLVEIAKKDNSQSPNFLPLLLYELGREEKPETRLIIMEYMPSMARHKVCIGPTLKTIQMIGSLPMLHAMAIRLLTQLWQLQDRCFPHLIKMITEKSNPSSYDVIIAQASAIKDICFLRPEQHGEDLLSPVSDILNKSSDVNMAPAAALVLEALYMMCEAEVIDIKSAWCLLAAKLSSEDRPAVVEKICDLFAIVPSLSTNTDEYDQFMSDILDKLWSYCHHSNPTIVGSAYQALASYSLDKFLLYHLPAQATKEIRLELEKKADQQQDGGVNLSVPVPSVCYLNILKTLQPEILEDFGVFMSGVVSKEVEDLPRGIYHSSTRRQTVVSSQGKAISSIPAFILSEYEKTNQPGLRPSLAVGLLFCYDPPIEVGRDGRPRRHYVISHGKNYQQMFTTLLQEVTIQPSEWHRCMLLPQAWTSFVDRLYTAVIESKKVEIDLQLKQGSIKEDEADEKKSTIWLSVRDMLTDEIKKASRQTPSMQGNSIYALSGLAIAVSRHVSSFDNEDMEKAKEIQRYRSHSDWMVVVLDTITCIMDMDYESKGDKLLLCTQADVNEKKPASLLARTSACVALSQLVPVMMTCDTDRIFHLITAFKNSLPGQSRHEHHSPVSQFYYGLATGMLLGRLFEEHFSDICGAKGMTEIWKALTVLEDCCFDKELENRSGAILGLGLSVSGLSQEGKTDSRVHVITIQEQMMKLCEELSVEDKSYQAICMSLACISGSAFDSNILPVEKINQVVDLLHSKHKVHPSVSSLSIALGMLCYSLHKIGHPSIDKLRETLVNSWTKSLTSEDSSPMEKVSVLNGLLAIIGSERTLIPVKTTSGLKGDTVSSNDIIKLASSMVESSTDLGLQSSAAWMLGHLYLSACAVAETRASVPPNYNYLKETSVIRAVVDLLLEAGKLGPEVVTDKHLEIALTALQDEVSRVLPPLNWAGVLTPLMRLEYGSKVKCLCLKLSVKQCMAAPTATTFLSSWMTSPLFESLPDDCKLVLYESLPYLMKAVANSVLQQFLEKSCMPPFFNKSDHCLSVLEGLNKALLVHDPPKAATSLLYEATERFYKNFPEKASVSLLCAMSKCYLNIPDQLFDQWTQDDFRSEKTFVNGVYIRCQLIALGRQPLALLNSCLDATINNKDCDRSKVFSIVSHCFYSMVVSKSELTGPSQQLQWLLELLGHIRNLALGIIKLDTSAPPLDQVLEFIIGIASSALCLWTMPGTGNLMGIKPNLLLSNPENPTVDSNVVVPEITPVKSLCCLPVTIRNLRTEPWLQLQPKVIDWMMSILKLPDTVVSQNVRQSLKASLYKLRDSDEFKKASIWTKVFVL